MVVDPELLEGLEAAVAASPDNVPLRLHLGLLLLRAGRHADALEQCAAVLLRVPDHRGALDLAASATMAVEPPRWATDRTERGRAGPQPPRPSAGGRPSLEAVRERPGQPGGPQGREPLRETARGGGPSVAPAARPLASEQPVPLHDGEPEENEELARGSQVAMLLDDLGLDIEPAGVTLADVGGMTTVKQWLASSGPVSQAERSPRRRLQRALRGGLLEYGPAGCGKTFMARAIAGELGVGFLPVDVGGLLELRPGEGQRTLHEVFEAARLAAPCLLLLDQLDALGDAPGTRQRSFSRGVVEQLVAELQVLREEHLEVTVVAASENPWDVDPLLRERMGRRLLVLPPDREAREVILWDAIGDYPVAELNVAALAGRTEGFSATDLITLADSAVEIATERALASGRDRPVSMKDFDRALVGVRPSPPAWLALARDFMLYAGHGGVYDDLLAYLRVRA
jgi:ATPase family associated with various cellular activities (AAA)